MARERYKARLDHADAMMLQFETSNTHFHTLKIAILDGSERGRPVTLDEVITWAPRYLGITPRLTQRVVRRSFWHWYWVDDPDFDIRQHVDERTLANPDGLDLLCGELASQPLDRSRPLWRLTLVHGLADGRQAAVAQIHHSIMDGSAAMNAFAAVTSQAAGTAPPVPEPTVPAPAPAASFPRRTRALIASAVASYRRTREFGPSPDVPRTFLRRTRFNPRRSGAVRVCGSTPLPAEEVQELARLIGTSVNGAVHATLAQALRDYMISAGDPPAHPIVVNFGVVEDPTSPRCEGNKLATARVWLHVDDPEPLSLAARTARSAGQSVALRRHRGFDLQRHANEYVWVIPACRNVLVDIPPITPVHVLTAYVSGPDSVRWLGDVEAVSFYSYAISLAPTDLSITAYRYAGQLWIGAVVTPEAMPDPDVFVEHVADALAALLAEARRDEETSEIRSAG